MRVSVRQFKMKINFIFNCMLYDSMKFIPLLILIFNEGRGDIRIPYSMNIQSKNKYN